MLTIEKTMRLLSAIFQNKSYIKLSEINSALLFISNSLSYILCYSHQYFIELLLTLKSTLVIRK